MPARAWTQGRSTAVVIVAAACVAGAAQITESAERGGCLPAGARTVVATRGAVVYERHSRRARPPRSGYGGVYYGCLRRRGRPVRLGVHDECYDNTAVDESLLRLAGRFAAFAYATCGLAEGGDGVHVYDLATGKLAATSFRNFSVVVSLVLTQRGVAAWIMKPLVTSPPAQEINTTEVRRTTSNGTDRLLDAGNGIDPTSIALSASRLPRVYWLNGGTPRSETLAP